MARNGSKWLRPEKRHAIYHRDGHCCSYCGVGVEEGAHLTLDHVISSGPNDHSNLITACFSCNSAKQDLTTRSWFARLRARGFNTSKIGRRIRRQLSKPLNMKEGRRIVALRREISK